MKDPRNSTSNCCFANIASFNIYFMCWLKDLHM